MRPSRSRAHSGGAHGVDRGAAHPEDVDGGNPGPRADVSLSPVDIDRLFREESGRILATLIRLLGDFDLAEEAMQDAFAVAAAQWPAKACPQSARLARQHGALQGDRSPTSASASSRDKAALAAIR